MTGHIPDAFIETLLSRVDIVELIGVRVKLKKAGANFVGLCPFHSEKTPSFYVNPTNPSKQFYHCFGCGVSGDAIHFLKEYEGLHFIEAIETLAERVGLPIPKEDQEHFFKSHTHLYELLKEANRYFQEKLREPVAAKAVQYLKSRGITGNIAKKFEIGFAPDVWEGLIRALCKPDVKPDVKQDIKKDSKNSKDCVEDLVLCGLVIRKDAKFYDRFRGRIMFPIRDTRGRIVGFGGRIFEEQEKNSAKYLNSPETPVFNKGSLLYGLYEARKGHRDLSTLIVVEGYIDVISLAQFGVTNVVATLGTALTEKHLELIFRYVSEIVLCFDGDKAGIEAANRSLKLSLPLMKEGRRIKFAFLPEKEDPDSFIRKKGREAFLSRLSHAKTLSDFLFDNLSQGLDLSHIDGRAELVTLAKPLISRLPKGVFQQMMWQRLSELAKIQTRTKLTPSSWTKGNVRDKMTMVSPAIRAAALLCQKPELSVIAREFKSLLALIESDGVPLLCALIEIFERSPTMTTMNREMMTEQLKAELPLELLNIFDLGELQSIASTVPIGSYELEFKGAIQRLIQNQSEKTLEALLSKASSEALSMEDKTLLKDLLDKREKDRVN